MENDIKTDDNSGSPSITADNPVSNDALLAQLAVQEKRGHHTSKHDEDERFAREIAYGVQQTFACWATDFIDPPVSNWLQNKFGNKNHAVTHGQTFGGEAIGDTSAFFMYLFAKRVLTKPVDALIAGVKKIADPLLTKTGKGAIKPWAETHGFVEGDERYQRKLEEYKNFQAENIVDSSIISASATGVNVAAQRALGNKQSIPTILGSKAVGASLTLGVMFLTRFFLPTATKSLDDEIAERYSSKGIKIVKKMLGLKDKSVTEAVDQAPEIVKHLPSRLAPEKREGLMKIMLEKAAKTDINDDAAVAKMLDSARDVFKAMLAAFSPDGYMVSVMAREYHNAMENKFQDPLEQVDAVRRSISREEAHTHIQATAAEKRLDLQLILEVMDDPNYIKEIRQAVASGKTFEIVPTKISDEEKKAISIELLTAHKGSSDVLDNAEHKADEYKALAHTLDPAGMVATILTQEMQKQLPHESHDEVSGIAKDYMKYYRGEAKQRAELFSPDKPLVREAQERAQSLRDKYMPATPKLQTVMSA